MIEIVNFINDLNRMINFCEKEISGFRDTKSTLSTKRDEQIRKIKEYISTTFRVVVNLVDDEGLLNLEMGYIFNMILDYKLAKEKVIVFLNIENNNFQFNIADSTNIVFKQFTMIINDTNLYEDVYKFCKEFDIKINGDKDVVQSYN